MTEIVQRWIQDRLGIAMNVSPEEFADKVKDGYMLAAILKSYDVITEEQLNKIEKSDSKDVCGDNFRQYILVWLSAMGIYVDNEGLSQIINAKGTAGLNLFYEMYLELHSNSNLYFITQQKISGKSRQMGRFTVHKVKDAKKMRTVSSSSRLYDDPLRNAQDIIHWQKDKMQMLQARCKEARETYLQYIRAYQTPKQRTPNTSTVQRSEIPSFIVRKEPDVKSVDMTYEELVKEQERVACAEKFVPDPQQSKTLLKKFRGKQREHSENLIFKMELQRDIFTNLWETAKKEEEESYNKNITDIIMKQSLYERQMHQKIGEVKFHKHLMLENKRNEAYVIAQQMEADFAQKLIVHDKEMDEREMLYYLEKERVMALHRKLYDHKIRMKSLGDEKMCAETVKDLVNLACNEAEYKIGMGEEAPPRVRNLWKRLFVNGIPLEDYVTPTEVILMKPEERPANIEDIVHLEIEKQEIIDKKDLENYSAFEWPWTLDNIKLEDYNLNDMTCGMNILGNLVHKLLATKYPLPPLRPKPNFPNITTSVCINGIDTNCLPVLQEILNTRDILVVQIEDCVDLCVKAYIEETTVEVPDEDAKAEYSNRDDKKTKGKGKEKKNAPKNEKKTKKGMKSKSKIVVDQEPVVEKSAPVDKMVQTPRYYPDEEIPLTAKAELGKIALEVLESGQALTTYIVVAMFVEYLKSKGDIKGWVLINFPKTYEEAAVLEEVLTGQPVPRNEDELDNFDVYQSIIDLLGKRISQNKEVDEFEVTRQSRILPQPVPPKQPEFYDTALTAYIKVFKRSPESEKRDKRGSQPSPPTLEELEDPSDPLDKFYADLGCNYHFCYNRMDFNATKYLAKLVVGDYSIPMKSSVELFGDKINYVGTDSNYVSEEPATATKKGEKKPKPKEKKPKVKNEKVTDTTDKRSKSQLALAKGKKGKKTKDIGATTVVISREDKYTQAPEVEEEECEEEVETDQSEQLPKPGEKGWPYVDLPIPESLQIAMATLWENAEEVYVVDLEQVLFLKRLIMNAVVPFISSVNEHMAGYMKKPDEKQKYLREFQRAYNEFENDFRSDEDFKAEVHSRINELKENLVEICDWKMIAADHERVLIIKKDWTSKQLIQLVNNYVAAMQLELDRFADSLTLIGDYYTAMVTQMPNETVVTKEILPKIELEHNATIQAINNLLQNVDDSDEMVLHQFVENTMKKCLNFVEAAHNLARSSLKKFKDLIDSENGTIEKSIGPKDKKSVKDKNKVDVKFDETILQKSSQLIDEWNCAVGGEVVRVKIRLDLLHADLFRNMHDVLDTIRKTFYAIYHDIRLSHEKELNSINTVCKILGLAVEREVKIQEEMILDKQDFYVNPEVILFTDKLPPVRPLVESVTTGVFTIDQLHKLGDMLMDLSPSGYMPERSFCYLLQDLIVSNDEPILLPELWRKLQPRHVDKILKYLFDDLEYVQWKDFIIHNLMVPFPNVEEILQLRNSFRALDPDATELITDYQFLEIKFWFESSIEDQYRLKLIRQLLFKLYRFRSDRLNYTALLLDFCKDACPMAGLAKALTVSLGKAVCWEVKVGEHFVEMSRRKKLYDEMVAKRKEKLEAGEDVVEQILTHLTNLVYDECTQRTDERAGVEHINDNKTESSKDTNSEGSLETAANTEIEPVPDLAYFLPLEVLLTVTTTCLPWHAKVQNLEDKSFREITEEIYEKCKNNEFGGKVLAHEFLNHPMMVEQLGRTCKFSIKNPIAIVEEVLQEKVEEKGRPKSRKR